MTSEERYIDGGGLSCPVCNSSNLGSKPIEGRSWGLTQEVYCNDCEAEWMDVYKLHSIAGLTRSRVPTIREIQEIAPSLRD